MSTLFNEFNQLIDMGELLVSEHGYMELAVDIFFPGYFYLV